MAKNEKAVSATKIVTGKCRASYVHLNAPAKIGDDGKLKYSVSVIIPKSDTVTLNRVNAAIQAAYAEGEGKLKGNGKTVPPLATLKTPLRDGDAERPDDPTYENAYFLNANSVARPIIVDRNRQEILDPDEIYSGMYARFSLGFYAFNSNGNRGIACGLNNVQKLADGEPLSGRSSPDEDFGDDYVDDVAEDFLG